MPGKSLKKKTCTCLWSLPITKWNRASYKYVNIYHFHQKQGPNPSCHYCQQSRTTVGCVTFGASFTHQKRTEYSFFENFCCCCESSLTWTMAQEPEETNPPERTLSSQEIFRKCYGDGDQATRARHTPAKRGKQMVELFRKEEAKRIGKKIHSVQRTSCVLSRTDSNATMDLTQGDGEQDASGLCKTHCTDSATVRYRMKRRPSQTK